MSGRAPVLSSGEPPHDALSTMSDYKYHYLLRLLCHVGHRAARAVFNSFDPTLVPHLTVAFIPLDGSAPMQCWNSDPECAAGSVRVIWDPDKMDGYRDRGKNGWRFDPFVWTRSAPAYHAVPPSHTAITISSSIHAFQDTAVLFLLHLDRSAHAAYPVLPQSITGDYSGERLNFVDRVAGHLLSELLHGVDSVLETRFVYPVKIDADRLLHRAAEDMIGVVDAFYNDDEDLPTLYEDLNTIASLRYQGHPAPASLLLLPDGSDYADVSLAFTEPISLADHRSVHRVMEMAEHGESLLCSGGCVAGLGRLKKEEREYKNVYKIVFARHLQWQFRSAGTTVMIVTGGRPLPSPHSFEKTALERALLHEFSGYSGIDIPRLWEIVQDAIGQSRATTLVISDAAGGEALRLKGESFAIRPQMLSPRLLRLAASAGGAVMIGPDGICHAIGVGLDGMASEAAGGARSGRLHTAVRYQHSARRYLGQRSVAVVISDEGAIDVISSLPTAVPREAVEEKFVRLAELLDTRHEGNLLEIHELLVWFDEHRAGLTAPQCHLLNKAMYWLPPDLHGYVYMPYYKTWRPAPDAATEPE